MRSIDLAVHRSTACIVRARYLIPQSSCAFGVGTRVPFKILDPDKPDTVGPHMSERQSLYNDVARKWHALAERRCFYLAELRDSGRWRRYYGWEEIVEAVREAADARDTWARLAGLPEGETPNPMGGVITDVAAEPWGQVVSFRKAG
jgi:hypothetical protein